MKKAVRGLKITGIVLLCLPFALVIIWLLWELFCAAVNNISGILHTQGVMNGYSNSSSIQVLDNVTFVGNTSGTGNHTEVRSTVLVKALNPHDLEYWTNYEYYQITSLSEEIPEYKLDRWNRELEMPYESEGCYVVEVYGDVPFPDSILGH
ncbi:MAG: hypothetical protein J6A19_00325 [Oscillospiraceae bacterium]|nr:hypothetical protein [Oscillospiraceae bacterium]